MAVKENNPVVDDKTDVVDSDDNEEGVAENDDDSNAYVDIFTFAKDYAKESYDDEQRRAESIISHAHAMQTVFAVVTAALFIIAQISFDYPEPLTRTYLFVIYSIIGFVLLLSLFAATVAQNRKKQTKRSKLKDFYDDLNRDIDFFRTDSQRAKYQFELYKDLHESLENNNNNRIIWVKISMYSFYAALGICVLLYFQTILKII